MVMFDFSQQRSKLGADFGRENVIQEQGMQLARQRFARNKQGLTQGFQRQFPGVTGKMAGMLGSGVRSGVANQGLGRFVGGFQQQMADMNTDFAGREAGFQQQQAARAEAYRQALLALDEQMANARLAQNPFAGSV
jgi:hypothetical protein